MKKTFMKFLQWEEWERWCFIFNNLSAKGFWLVPRIEDAEVVLLCGGRFEDQDDAGYMFLSELLVAHSIKSFYLVHQNGLHQDFKNNPRVFSNGNLKLEF